MTYLTTLEIDEIETEVKVDFTNRFGEIEITGMSDSDNNEIAPDLLSEINTAKLYADLASYADDEQIELENTYSNIY